jgi:hypothetical protein
MPIIVAPADPWFQPTGRAHAPRQRPALDALGLDVRHLAASFADALEDILRTEKHYASRKE